mmetsp:Transcript_66669/g.159375  ORF Transcript_66669/g.159375 Transcript_66669/m.159375 type:complete len:213 (-) Transcript_66669:1545-2183(-)
MTDAASAMACGPTSCSTMPTCARARAGQSLSPSPMKPTSTGPVPHNGASMSRTCFAALLFGDPAASPKTGFAQEASLIAVALSSGMHTDFTSLIPTAFATARPAFSESPVSRTGWMPSFCKAAMVLGALARTVSSMRIIAATAPSTDTKSTAPPERLHSSATFCISWSGLMPSFTKRSALPMPMCLPSTSPVTPLRPWRLNPVAACSSAQPL